MYRSFPRLEFGHRWPAWLGLLAVLRGVCGLSAAADICAYHPVRGSVTLDKNPLAEGVIAFISPESGDLQAVPIKDGKYEGRVRAGKRRVEIRAYRPRKGPKKPLEPPPTNYLPKRYNSETTLTADVSAQGPNTFDFDLLSK